MFISLQNEYPDDKMGFTRFTQLRPRSVRVMGSIPPETCACVYCLNVKIKIDVLNRSLRSHKSGARFPSERKMLEFLLCPKEDGAEWHKKACMDGKRL